MIALQTLEQQLKDIGCNFRFFGRPEIRELAKILTPGECISNCVNGIYEGGFALLAITDQRLLLIDRKPMYLTIEDIRFDMIAEIDYNHRLLNATARIYSTNKQLAFTSWNHTRLRNLIDTLQCKVMQMRHQLPGMQAQFASALPATATESQQIPASVQVADAPPVQTQATVQQRKLPLFQPKIARLAMDGATEAVSAPSLPTPSVNTNPYARIPLISRHKRKFPSFY